MMIITYLSKPTPHCTTGQITESLFEDALLRAAYKVAVVLATAHADGRGHAVSLKRSHCADHHGMIPQWLQWLQSGVTFSQ
eukprot:scaffold242592_cov21-Tisochrysis_lutea.AAC.1